MTSVPEVTHLKQPSGQLAARPSSRKPKKENSSLALDMERLERFKAVMLSISAANNLANVFSIVINEMPEIIPCASCSIFVLMANVIKNKDILQ